MHGKRHCFLTNLVDFALNRLCLIHRGGGGNLSCPWCGLYHFLGYLLHEIEARFVGMLFNLFCIFWIYRYSVFVKIHLLVSCLGISRFMGMIFRKFSGFMGILVRNFFD